MTQQEPAAPRKRRWFQWSLRALLVFVLLCAISCSWLAVRLREVQERREAVATIEGLNGHAVCYYWMGDEGTLGKWLRSALGDDFFATFYHANVSHDAAMKCLQKLPQLKSLTLYSPQVTDAELKYLTDLPRLEKISVIQTGTTDAGMTYLRDAHQLRKLVFLRTEATGPGLAQLKEMPHLEELAFFDTRTTNLTLMHLKDFSQLRSLVLVGTCASPEAVSELQEALPNCAIDYRDQ